MTVGSTPAEVPVVGPETVLRRVADVAWVPIDHEYVLHRATTNTGWVLNAVAGLVWRCLDGHSTVGEILADVADAFGVEEDRVRDDFLPVLDGWVRDGLAEDPTDPWDPEAALGDFRPAGWGRWRRLDFPPNDCGKAEPQRWPHRAVIDVDGTALTVGSDDPGVIEALAPFAIDLDTELVDYVLQLDPPRLEGPGLRSLPAISWGCQPLFRLRDREELRRAWWRLLASFARPRSDREVRLRLMPLVREGRALLVPPSHAGAISHRWYEQAGITPWYTGSCVVDAADWTVRVDAPLVAESPADAVAPEPIPVLDWWLPAAVPDYDLAPGEALAHVMRIALGVTPANAPAVLAAAARLVDDRLPGLAPIAPDRYVEALHRGWADVMRREVWEAIRDRFARG